MFLRYSKENRANSGGYREGSNLRLILGNIYRFLGPKLGQFLVNFWYCHLQGNIAGIDIGEIFLPVGTRKATFFWLKSQSLFRVDDTSHDLEN